MTCGAPLAVSELFQVAATWTMALWIKERNYSISSSFIDEKVETFSRLSDNKSVGKRALNNENSDLLY